ncbi:MAG TPA: BON domain-containing protein, partial [Gemmataceae bacterium]|nr:BON domain-containing protein [Gemmataceae bacterium]
KKLTFRDIQLTVFVRKALADDPVVGPVNLGVRVQDNVAVLWGPAPSEAVRRRAVELTKKAPGVFEVRDADVYIAAPAPPAPTPVPLPPPPETPTLIESDSPQAPTGKSDAAPAAPAVDSPPAPTVVLRPPTPATDGPPAQLVSAASLDDLAAAVARVRLAEERFHAVNYHMDGDAVVLYMGAGRAEEVMAFARSIAHLPGLVRIEVVGADGTGPR